LKREIEMPALGSRTNTDMSTRNHARKPATPEHAIRFDAGWHRVERELIRPLRDAVESGKGTDGLFPRAKVRLQFFAILRNSSQFFYYDYYDYDDYYDYYCRRRCCCWWLWRGRSGASAAS
jgi:hypothetical protein